MSFFYIQLLLSHVKTKDLNINDSTIYIRKAMPSYEECMRIINPLRVPEEALSYTEKIFLQFCEFWDSYPEEIKKVVKRW